MSVHQAEASASETSPSLDYTTSGRNGQSLESQPKGLLDLPAELRETIYTFVVVKPTNTITMLYDAQVFKNEVSASQPALAQVNRQLRSECLATFYSSNTFTASLDNTADLVTAIRWINAVGQTNAADLRNLVMGGWTRLPYGHMSQRVWVKVVVDLHERTLWFDDEASQFPTFRVKKERFEEVFRGLCEERGGRRFDVRALSVLMEGVNVMCSSY